MAPCAHTETCEVSVLGQAEGQVLRRTGAQNSMGHPQGPPWPPWPSLGGRPCPAPMGPTEPNPAASVTPTALSGGHTPCRRAEWGTAWEGPAPPRPARSGRGVLQGTGAGGEGTGLPAIVDLRGVWACASSATVRLGPWAPGLEPPWWRTAGERALKACSHLSLKAGCTHFDTACGFGGLGVSYKISRGGRTAARAHRECAAPTPPDPGSSPWPPCGPVAWPGLVLWVTLRSSLSGTDLSVLSSVTPAN